MSILLWVRTLMLEYDCGRDVSAVIQLTGWTARSTRVVPVAGEGGAVSPLTDFHTRAACELESHFFSLEYRLVTILH